MYMYMYTVYMSLLNMCVNAFLNYISSYGFLVAVLKSFFVVYPAVIRVYFMKMKLQVKCTSTDSLLSFIRGWFSSLNSLMIDLHSA